MLTETELYLIMGEVRRQSMFSTFGLIIKKEELQIILERYTENVRKADTATDT